MISTLKRPLPKGRVADVVELAKIQRMMAAAIMRPLEEGHMQKAWLDGSAMETAATKLIKPNSRLNSYERLEIYNQQYWYRVLDSLHDDFSGLAAVLGEARFEELAVAYLTRYPSNSFTLNDLGSRLEAFILEEPDMCGEDHELALELVRFEWAEIVASDRPELPILTKESLAGIAPQNLRLKLQPHVALLECQYALDEFLQKLNKRQSKTIESNAVVERKRHSSKRLMPQRQHNYIAFHRSDNIVYYKRLEKYQYLILSGLASNKSIGQICQELEVSGDEQTLLEMTARLRQDFSVWMELGWFCGPS
jgi:hypothetical protein